MSDNTVSIRAAKTEDRPGWETLWQDYLVFYKSRLPAQTTDLLWHRILDPAHEFQCRLAVTKSGNSSGFVHFFPHAHTWYQQPVCYLNDLFVSPDIRRGGIGRALIEAVVEEASAQGWAEVYWLTQYENHVARGLYDRITGGADGFVAYTIDMAVRN